MDGIGTWYAGTLRRLQYHEQCVQTLQESQDQLHRTQRQLRDGTEQFQADAAEFRALHLMLRRALGVA